MLRRDVGVYPPTDAQIDAFAAAYLEAVRVADVVAQWGDRRMPSFDAEQFVVVIVDHSFSLIRSFLIKTSVWVFVVGPLCTGMCMC